MTFAKLLIIHYTLKCKISKGLWGHISWRYFVKPLLQGPENVSPFSHRSKVKEMELYPGEIYFCRYWSLTHFVKTNIFSQYGQIKSIHYLVTHCRNIIFFLNILILFPVCEHIYS